MIEFANEWVRNEFHLLSADVQKEYHDLSLQYANSGHVITIVGIEKWGPGERQLEIDIRIDKKFNPVGAE